MLKLAFLPLVALIAGMALLIQMNRWDAVIEESIARTRKIEDRVPSSLSSEIAPLVVALRSIRADMEALAQEHGPDARCEKHCTPSDVEFEWPDEVPVYSCEGTCNHGETDPCAEGVEARNCGEYCRKACCECAKAHCP